MQVHQRNDCKCTDEDISWQPHLHQPSSGMVAVHRHYIKVIDIDLPPHLHLTWHLCQGTPMAIMYAKP